MSSRQRRVERRARARACDRLVLAAARPASVVSVRPCLVDGCPAEVPAVRIGPVDLALCPVHKALLDDRWTAALSNATTSDFLAPVHATVVPQQASSGAGHG